MEGQLSKETEVTHIVTVNFDLTHDLNIEFSRSNFEIAVSQEWED